MSHRVPSASKSELSGNFDKSADDSESSLQFPEVAPDDDRVRSSLQSEDTPSSPWPGKRNIGSDSVPFQSRVKRLKTSYSDDYRKLVNECIDQVAPRRTVEGNNQFLRSRVGMSMWGSLEKAEFFRSLSLRGRHGLQSIAADIGTKGESEVQEYIALLQKASFEQQLYESSDKSLKPVNLDASFEVGHACCAVLDIAAETLSTLQRKTEAKAERKKYRDFSVLSFPIAKWVDQRLSVGENGEREISRILPAAALLDLKQFLRLSKRIFMNSSIEEYNWRTCTEKCRPPSIMHTAFLDLHALVVSVTKRLVQSSIFIALSRLRAMGSSRPYSPCSTRQPIRRQDIRSANLVLGMRANRKQFWAATARKCNLRVYEEFRGRENSRTRLSYDEAEELLGWKGNGVYTPGRESTNNTKRDQTQQSSANDSETSPEISLAGDKWSSSSLDEFEYNPSAHSRKQILKQDRLERSYDFYAEALDQRASCGEERRLWEMFDSRHGMRLEVFEQLRAPQAKRKDEDNLGDWTSSVVHCAEWEVYDKPIHTSSFNQDRPLGRSRELLSRKSDSEQTLKDINSSQSSEQELDP